MEPRRQIQRTREVRIEVDSPYDKVRKKHLMKALEKMEEEEQLIDIIHIQEHRESGWGMDEDTQIWCDWWELHLAKYTPETDDEYLKRKQSEERWKKEAEEREVLEYLRLKAKFENDISISGRCENAK